jgi:primosomal protein N' (replication factor Y)
VNPAARVVPDVASFSVDDGFWYSVPDHLREDLSIGSIVRVPLSGRRVRGWVVELAEDHPGELKGIAGLSGEAAVFDADLLQTLAWAARHYVAPMSALLTRATPPNLPHVIPEPSETHSHTHSGSALGPIVERSVAGLHGPTTALVANWQTLDWLSACAAVLEAGKSVVLIAASVAEVERIRDSTPRDIRPALVAVTGDNDASDTEAWELAQSPPRLVVGTPKTAMWMVKGLDLAIVLEESRRAMKDRQTPTLHVREVMRTRTRIEGFNLVFFGPTPSVELLAAGAEVVRVGNRAWPLVEVVDRSDDPPGSGYLSARVVTAIGTSVSAGGQVFVYTHRRAAHSSLRCARCRALRVCENCGARLGRVQRCAKCHTPAGPCRVCGGSEFEEMGTIPERLVAEINRRIGPDTASTSPGDTPVMVGTERDLAGMAPVGLAVAADLDGMLMGVGYRTSEEALRQLARLASLVAPGSGARLMVQTSRPESLLVTAMRRGDPIPYLERVLVERAREGAPPSTEMIALEVRGQVPKTVMEDLAGLGPDAIVLGPMNLDDGRRWLLTGKLGPARIQLRKMVGRWRDRGATVRVDADPIDV